VAFERSIALELGRHLGLPEPGAAFDRLAGRWIELRGRAGYKPTPLLNGQAQELWSAERVRQTHALLLDSFMATKSIRLDQAMGLFLHAFQSQDAPRFGKFVSTMAFHIERTEGLAEALELVLHVGSVDGAPAIAFGEGASILFRYLQFRVARARRPELLPEIARRWRWEIERLSQPLHRDHMFALRGMALAMAVEGSFSAATVVESMQDAARLENLGLNISTITAANLEIPSADPQDIIDPIPCCSLLHNPILEAQTTSTTCLSSCRACPMISGAAFCEALTCRLGSRRLLNVRPRAGRRNKGAPI